MKSQRIEYSCLPAVTRKCNLRRTRRFWVNSELWQVAGLVLADFSGGYRRWFWLPILDVWSNWQPSGNHQQSVMIQVMIMMMRLCDMPNESIMLSLHSFIFPQKSYQSPLSPQSCTNGWSIDSSARTSKISMFSMCSWIVFVISWLTCLFCFKNFPYTQVHPN